MTDKTGTAERSDLQRMVAVAAIGIVLALVTPHAAAQCHAITDLGTLPGASAITVRDLNNAGQVVGYALTSTSQAFLYRGGVMMNLGALGGSESFAHGVNDSGQVVGSAQTASGDMHAFLYTGGTMIDLNPTGSVVSAATAINNAGQVAGVMTTAGGACHGFVWQNGVTSDIGELGANTCDVWDINNLGEIVGVLESDTGEPHAFICTPTLGVIDLGTLGGAASYPYRVNDLSRMVGSTWTNIADPAAEPTELAFLYRNGGVTHLGTLGGQSSAALGINNVGQIVGTAQTAAGEVHAFLFDDTNGMRDLNGLVSPTSGWTLQSANAINDAGLIAGVGLSNGQPHAFLLTPDQTDADADGVPDACESAPPSTPACGSGTLAAMPFMLAAFVPLRRRVCLYHVHP